MPGDNYNQTYGGRFIVHRTVPPSVNSSVSIEKANHGNGNQVNIADLV